MERTASIRLLALGLWLVVSACSAQRAVIDFDPNENYAAMRTWAWLPASDKAAADTGRRNDLLDRRIRSAISETMTTMGYPKAFEKDADFLIAFHTVVDTKTSVQTTPGYVGATYPYGYGYGRYSRYGYGVSIPPQTTVRQHQEGTLIIDLLDARDKELFWRGNSSTRLPKRPTPQEITSKVNQAVAEILAHFPPH